MAEGVDRRQFLLHEADAGSASASPERRVSRRRDSEIGKLRQVALWIQVLLRVEPELPLSRLAEELGVSDRQVGKALGLLIRERRVRIRDAPAGLRVILCERAPRAGTDASRPDVHKSPP
jgi:hypothetical protein